MATAVTLVLLTIITRLISPTFQIWNLVPAGAIALYAARAYQSVGHGRFRWSG